MNPEISVISTVRLYFKSPAADAKKEAPVSKDCATENQRANSTAKPLSTALGPTWIV